MQIVKALNVNPMISTAKMDGVEIGHIEIQGLHVLDTYEKQKEQREVRNRFYEIVGANTPFAFIQSVYILPQFRGSGLGKRLMLAGIEQVRKMGLTRIVIEVSKAN